MSIIYNGNQLSDVKVCQAGLLTNVNRIEKDGTVLYQRSAPSTPNYLTIVPLTDLSIRFYFDSGNVEYSLNNGSWINYTKGSRFNISTTDNVRLRGYDVITSGTNHFVNESGYFNMTGSVTSLTDGNGGNPNVTLQEACYASMFRNCTWLQNPPELPAVNLSDYCYSNMFNGCRAMITCPTLPSMNLAKGCYIDMLANTLISEFPTLPATIVPTTAYSGMVNGCTLLTSANLPATNISYLSYCHLFNGCTRLSEVNTNMTTFNLVTYDDNYPTQYGSWMSNVSTSGTFRCPSSLATQLNDGTITRSIKTVPYGWTVEAID